MEKVEYGNNLPHNIISLYLLYLYIKGIETLQYPLDSHCDCNEQFQQVTIFKRILAE